MKHYLITVTAHGMTSSYAESADDLLDAIMKAKRLQDRDIERIVITLAAEQSAQSYLEVFKQ